MIRTHLTLPAAALTLAAALTGCSDSGKPAPDPSPTAAATTATPARTAASRLPADPVTQELAERAVCNRIAGLSGDAQFDAAQNLNYGQQAEALADPRMSRAGRDLVKAAGAAQAAPGPDTNIDLSKAQLAVLDVCGDKYGDGPW
ncbi:hypothetical protein AB0L22_09095 [Micromonospora haikouensis]|uniref:hypothetical protein n=1 Tax=Micromonospora haikouensis TaxID=686309 RepID=UPI00341BB07E